MYVIYEIIKCVVMFPGEAEKKNNKNENTMHYITHTPHTKRKKKKKNHIVGTPNAFTIECFYARLN